MMVSSNSSPGKRHPGVDEALRHQVQPTADEAGGAADQHRHHDGEDGGGQPHRQRQPRPVDEAAQQVAPDVVGAQQVGGRGGLQAIAQVDLLVAVGRQRIGEDADQHQEQDDDAAGGAQRLLAHQPREELPEPGLSSRNRAPSRLGDGRRQLGYVTHRPDSPEHRRQPANPCMTPQMLASGSCLRIALHVLPGHGVTVPPHS